MNTSDGLSADELEIRVQERIAELEKANQELRAEIFERKRMESELVKLKDKLEIEVKNINILHKLSTQYVEGSDLYSIFQEIIEAAVIITGAEKGAIQILDPSTGNLKITAQKGFSLPFLKLFECLDIKESVACKTALEQMKHVVVKDITQSSTFFGSNALDILLDEGVRAFRLTPLVSLSGQLLGIMSVYFTQIHTPAEREQIIIDILARQAAEIIKRKQVEEELHESQEDLYSTQAVGNIGNWRLDMFKNSLTWSNENHRIFGIPKGTPLTYETFLSAVHPDDREYVDKKWKAGFAGEPLYDLEHRVVVNGKVKWVHQKASLEFNKNGTLIGGFGITQDITERKKVEEALRQSEQRIRLKLDTILSPASEIANLELAEIIDAQVIQSLMDDFYKLAHIPIGIIDLKGNVLVGVGWQDICTKFHRVHPETLKHCVESDTQLSTGVLPGKFKPYRCKNNMWDIATPIIVGGQHVGNIFLGQFFFEGESLDYELFRSQARKYGFNEEEYIAALEKVPWLSPKVVDTIMAFFMKLSNMLSQLGYRNIKLAQSLAERDTLMEALHQSEIQYKMLFDHSTDAIILSDPRGSGKILSVNPAACRMLGWAAEELIGKGRDVLFDPEDSMVSHVLDEVINSGSAKAQLIYKRKDGTTFPGEISTSLFTDSSGEPRTVIIIRDITERKQIEDTLAFERSQLLSIFDGMDDVVYVTDPYTNEVLYANRSMKEKFGGELVGGICYQEFQHQDSPCDCCTNPIILKEKSKAYFWEYYNPTVGRYFMIMDRIIKWPDGRDVRFEIAKDITERKKAEEALRLSYLYNRSLIEASLDPLVTIGPNGKITDVNGATELITGYSRNDLIGTDFSDYFTEPEKSRQGYQQAFTDSKVWDYFLEIQHKDGHITPVLYNASVYRDENGKVIGVFAAARDITESKKAEEALKKYMTI
jgi:PAS domain S-box-containing protein